MPFASVGKYKIFYVDEGEGFPIVLIHGLAGDHQAWAPQIAALRGRHRVIAFDNRGAGKSTQVDEPVTTEDLARDTLGLMDALGVSRAHIVGRSMGGSIAQHIALRAPDRVQSLVLCASFAKLDPLGMRVLTNMREVLEWRGSWADHARHSVQNFVSAEFFNTQRDSVAQIERLDRRRDAPPRLLRLPRRGGGEVPSHPRGLAAPSRARTNHVRAVKSACAGLMRGHS
jgi:3-oxoadipate enol-lactonase